MVLRDMMGNSWQLADGAISVALAAAAGGATVAVPTPAGTATALACDFGGYVWTIVDGTLYRLNPRGPGYTDNGMGKRDAPGDEPTACVGEFGGDYEAHTKWVAVALPEKAVALRQPHGSDLAIVA